MASILSSEASNFPEFRLNSGSPLPTALLNQGFGIIGRGTLNEKRKNLEKEKFEKKKNWRKKKQDQARKLHLG